MNNDQRFEIKNKIITVEQIKDVSDYLQKTCNYYIELIKQDSDKNNNVFFDRGNYKYYAFMKPELKYSISYADGREIKTEDYVVFNDALKEPQYLKGLVQQLYISYKDNEMNEVTEHTMSVYISYSENSVMLSTTEKNMGEQLYNINSYIRGLLESGEDRYSGVVKNKLLVKNIIGLAAGSLFTLVMFFIILIIRAKGNNVFDTIFINSFLPSLLGWLTAFAIGSVLIKPIIENLFREIDNAKSVYSTAGMKETYKKEYMSQNEVLIGKSYNNLEKRNSIRKIYSISKKVVLVRLVISVIIIIVLSIS